MRDAITRSEDPLRAIEDALRTFGADEIIFAARRAEGRDPAGRRVVANARERFALPIAHVVIETGIETGAATRL